MDNAEKDIVQIYEDLVKVCRSLVQRYDNGVQQTELWWQLGEIYRLSSDYQECLNDDSTEDTEA